MQLEKQIEQVQKRVTKAFKDIQEYQKRWEDLNTRGADMAGNLINNRLRVQYLASYQWGFFEECRGVKEITKQRVTQNAEKDYKNLQKNYGDLVYIHSKMKGIVADLQNFLHYLQESESYKIITEQALFSTLQMPQLVQLADECLEMYNKELDVKKAILEDIDKNNNRELLTIYMTTWSIQPYIAKKMLEYFNDVISTDLSLSLME